MPEVSTLTRQLKVLSWCFPALLHDSVKQGHFHTAHGEENACNPSAVEVATNLPEVRLKLAHQRHSQRLEKLHQLDVFTNDLAVLPIQFKQPVAYRFAAELRTKEQYT